MNEGLKIGLRDIADTLEYYALQCRHAVSDIDRGVTSGSLIKFIMDNRNIFRGGHQNADYLLVALWKLHYRSPPPNIRRKK